MNKKTGLSKHLDFIIIDLLCLTASFILATYIRFNSINAIKTSIYRDMLFVIIAINLILCFFYEPYENVLRRKYFDEFKKTITYDTLSFLLVILYLFIVKESSNYSRIIVVLTYIVYFLLSYSTRNIWKNCLQKKSIDSLSKGSRSLLIISKYDDIDKTIQNISNNNYDNFYISAICLMDNKVKDKKCNEYKVIGNLNVLLKYISTNWVDDILIASNYKKIPKDIMIGINETGIPIHIELEKIDSFDGKIQIINRINNIDVITAINRTYSNLQIFMKRVMDIVGGVIGCIITLFLIAIIGPIIYIKSPGSIFYVSERVGKNGKIFKFYKFRSMVLNADDLKNDLKKNNRIKDGMMFKLDDDPRIIPGIGHFIRKTSLDEFPQFFNVLKNDMSLVGTRPPTLDEWNRYSPYYRSRLSIKPGITGLWQISGRSNITNFDEVVKLDNEYINKWTLSLDIKIIAKTIHNLFDKENKGAL